MQKKINPWKTLSSKQVFKNKYYSIKEDQVIRPNGDKGVYSVLLIPPSVFIIALDKDDKFPLVGQFRYTTRSFSWELPGGGSEGKDPLLAAKKELEEETGLVARDWTECGRVFAYNGISNEQMVIFIARDLKQTGKAELGEEGIIESKRVSFKECFDMIDSGEFNDSQCIAALTRAALYLKKI